MAAAPREAGIHYTEARPLKRDERRRGKSDSIGAGAAARSVLCKRLDELIVPRDGKERYALRVLLAARRAMDSHRTADRNALTALGRTIDLGIDARRALTNQQISQIAAWRPRPTDDIEQQTARTEAVRLARSVLSLTIELSENKTVLRVLISKLAPALLDRAGVGPVTAATFLTTWSHPGRVRSEAAFAALAGAAPIPASSGNTVRYRLSRQGDRQLNRALDVVARSRMNTDPDTRAYAARRRADGKTTKESAVSSSATSPAKSTANSPRRSSR